jgi:rubrerythrin
MKEWIRYFQENREHRLEIPPGQIFCPEAPLRAPLIRSLRRFQLGESGEGRHWRQHAALTGDCAYQQCVDLFIKEEQDHARMMARILRGLGAPLLPRHWSNSCFVLLRRMFGLEEELLTLLVPEMMAQRFFGALHDGTRDEGLRAVFAQIIHDENGHVAFHTDVLRRRLARLPLARRALLRAGWRVIFRAAGVAVMLDHRAVLRAVGIAPAAFWWDCGLIFDEVAASLFRFSGEGAFRFSFPVAKA